MTQTIPYPFLRESLLDFLSQHSHTGSLSNVNKIKKSGCPVMGGDEKETQLISNWKMWKRKGDALFRVEEPSLSLTAYNKAFRGLSNQRSSAMSSNNWNSVIEINKIAAKISTNVSLIFLNSPSLPKLGEKVIILQSEKEFPKFQNGFYDLDSLAASIMKGMIYAFFGIEWNICWPESYKRLKSGVK